MVCMVGLLMQKRRGHPINCADTESTNWSDCSDLESQ